MRRHLFAHLRNDVLHREATFIDTIRTSVVVLCIAERAYIQENG